MTERDFSRRMEIETQMAADRERAAEMEREKASAESLRRAAHGTEGGVVVGPRPISGLNKEVKKGGSAVRKPAKRKGARGF